MAGMEQLEIHSKSYIVRWVKVEEGHTISWSVQPHKKSINFGIVKHPGVGNSSTATPKIPSGTAEESLAAHQPDTSSDSSRTQRPSSTRNDSSTAQELLKSKGFIPIYWHGKCEADKVSMGTHAVRSDQGGMYGLVFDNTFSKTVSKTATFALLTYPSNAPPNTSYHDLKGGPGSISIAIGGGSKGQSPRLGATASDSVDSLHSHSVGVPASRSASVLGRGDTESSPSTYHVGLLLKRRRKRGQGYARRYFSLDFVSCTLSYYYSRNSSALRGAIPLSLAAIVADERRREINIDSGAEVWHLRASNAKDFGEWTKALETASNTARGLAPPIDLSAAQPKLRTSGLPNGTQLNVEEEREWGQVESLVSRIVGTRDAIRRLTKDTSSLTRQTPGWFGLSSGSPNMPEDKGDYFAVSEKRSFWKRKASPSTPRSSERSVSSQLAIPAPETVASISANDLKSSPSHKKQRSREENSIHDHCVSLLSDLDSVLSEFSILIASSKRRRMPAPRSATMPRESFESGSADEFYDAEGGDEGSPLVMIQRQSEEDTPGSEADDEFVSDNSSLSSMGEDELVRPQHGEASFFPAKPKSLSPLPISTRIKRRTTVPPATVLPPSLVSFLSKNVGKDLSTISMPVSANEPTGLLQRVAEALEYTSLLDTASEQKLPTQRLIHVAAFSVSYFANGRARERAIRKPFNPMLGETYELVRGDGETPGNFRFIAEKVSHRPVKMACQADSPNWSLSHSLVPSQKFWGKSAELITEGRLRVVLRLKDGTDECYSWNVATVFLRNIVMGEKYVEPVGTMTVVNETTGAKATIEFKSKSMFGGRSEDVVVESYNADGTHTGISLAGTWTSCLRIIEAGKATGPEIWKVGKLVKGSEVRCGLTEFAAGLNEITEVEEGKLPVTDTRYRNDQRAVESGHLDVAEVEKAKLEDMQRERRRLYEARGEEWKARWFTRVDTGDQAEEVWRLKSGKDGYWEERAKGVWTGVEDVLGVGAQSKRP